MPTTVSSVAKSGVIFHASPVRTFNRRNARDRVEQDEDEEEDDAEDDEDDPIVAPPAEWNELLLLTTAADCADVISNCR
jgi:hypothetical protein